jgi:hypothetical protein
MATLTKRTELQPRFTLSMGEGRLAYTCRGCAHQYPHPAPMMKHLQACKAFARPGIVDHESVYNPWYIRTDRDQWPSTYTDESEAELPGISALSLESR